MYFCIVKTKLTIVGIYRIKGYGRWLALVTVLAWCVLCSGKIWSQSGVDSTSVELNMVRSLNLPPYVCAGGHWVLDFGFSSYHTVHVQNVGTHGHDDTVFLPDGIPCGEMGCSYRSPVVFNEFNNNAVITSANDILYVLLNIEHSWIADIYINITCPNGQSADLMHFGGIGNSDCQSQIDSTHRGWNSSYDNTSRSTHFGFPVDFADYQNPCNSSSQNNRPGVGWNYCWSSNNTGAYTYALDDGLIYRERSSHNYSVDSSDVVAGNNFYHPEDSFANLIGCPVNGEWYIEVMDGWGGDNGYIFRWDLALDPYRLPLWDSVPCVPEVFDIVSDYVTRIDSTHFLLNVPADMPEDTLISLTFEITNSCGDSFDTTATVLVHNPYLTSVPESVVACDSYLWNGHLLTVDTFMVDTLTSLHGCDSVTAIDLLVLHSSGATVYDTIVENDLPYTWCGITLFARDFRNSMGRPVNNHTATAFTLVNAEGCDSVVTHSVYLYRNIYTILDSTVCQNWLPVEWNDVIFTADSNFADSVHHPTPGRLGGLQIFTDSSYYAGSHGVDSIVVMRLLVLDTSCFFQQAHACDSMTWIDGHTYTVSDTIGPLIFTNSQQCDSMVYLDLTVDYSRNSVDRQTVCDSMLWIDGQWYTADTMGVVYTIGTVGDCDSAVTLDLTVNHSAATALYDTMCYDDTYQWRRYMVHSDSLYRTEDFLLTDTLRTVLDCDSVLRMTVTKMAKATVNFDVVAHCQDRNYTLTADARAPFSTSGSPQPMPYIVWSSAPADSLLDGHERQPSILVAPSTVTEYFLFTDYRETPFCPSTTHVALRPMVVPAAQLMVNPERLGYDNLWLDAYDLTPEMPSSTFFEGKPEWQRTWYLDDVPQQEQSSHFEGQANADHDSVVVTLEVYNGQCHDSASAVIPIYRVALFAPNIFTPTEDINNRFTIVTVGVLDADLYVYNREGMMVCHTTDLQQGWDGRTVDGLECPQSAYVWKLFYHAIDRPEVLQVRVGTVTLVR